MKSLILVSLMLTGSLTWASRLEIVGEGVQVVPAEYLRLTMSVVAKCHTSASAARTQVDQLVTQVQELLKPHADAGIGDQIQLSIGGNSQQIITKYVDNENVVICDEAHSWQADSSVTFKLTRLADLAALQDAILNFAAQNNVQNGVNTPGLILDLSNPQPGVLAETWDKMNDEALKMAYNQALRQVKVVADLQQPNAQIELVKMTATRDTSGNAVYDRVTGSNDSNGSSFGKVSLRLSRLFTFNVK